MAYEDQDVQGGLAQAATSPNVTQKIQELLLSRIHTPVQQQQLEQQRQGALEQLQGSVRADPTGGYMPSQRSFDAWIENIGKTGPAMAAIRGVAEGNKLAQLRSQQVRDNEVTASKLGYQDVTDRSKLDVQELGALKTLAGGAKGNSPTVKMDKDGNMVVYDPISGSSKIVHSSQRGEYQRIWSKAYEKAVSEQMGDPENYAHGVAANVLGISSPGTTTPSVGQPVTPSAAPNTETAPSAPKTSNTSASPSIQYLDKPEQKRKEEFATGLEKGAIKDFEENVKPAAAIADSMLNTIGMLKQIPRSQDAFAPWREKLGSAMNALGMDGTMVREAENLQQVRPMLAKIANDRLLMAKGTQTEGDAQRAYNEFIQITDTQKAVDFMYAWTEELANRAKFKKAVYEDSAQTEGTMGKAGKAWESTDYSKTAPVAILNGKPWSFTKWRDQFIKSNPNVPLNETIDVWNKLARGGK